MEGCLSGWIGIIILIFILVIIIVFIALLWGIVNGCIFMQSTEVNWSPVGYDEKQLNSGVIMWHKQISESRPVVIFNHGSWGNIDQCKFMDDVAERSQVNLILFDYRGYGKSGASGALYPNPTSILEDSEEVYREACSIYSPMQIILWGHSLGCCGATYVAQKHACKSLVLISGFSSLPDVPANKDGYTYQAAAGLVKYGTNNLEVKEWLPEVKCPVVIVHSRDDNTVPYKCAEINYDACTSKYKKIITITGEHCASTFTKNDLRNIYKYSGMYDDMIDYDRINQTLAKQAEEMKVQFADA